MSLQTWKKGVKITKPGMYDGIPLETYHGDITDGPGISSSGLRTIESQSPFHYYATSYLNPNRYEKEKKRHFMIGGLVHSLTGGESVGGKIVVRPDQWKDWRTKDARDWRDALEAEGKIVLTPEEHANLRGAMASLSQHPLIEGGLLHGAIEQSLFFKDKQTSVWLKSRPDVIPVADGVVADVKTTTDASPDAVRRAILDHGYAMQGALVGRALKEVLGIEMTDFVLVFIEKEPPYAVNVAPVDPEWIHWAGRQMRRAIDAFAKCVETGHWPGYEGENTVSMPDWLRKKFEFESDNGLLPEEKAA